MAMIKNLKTNSALLLCTVFVFGILFANVGVVSSFDKQQNNSSMKASFSTIMKMKTHTEALNNSGSCEYPVEDIYEEDSNDDNQFKSNVFFPIKVLSSLVAGESENKLKKAPSYTCFSYTSSNKYLVFQSIRV